MAAAVKVVRTGTRVLIRGVRVGYVNLPPGRAKQEKDKPGKWAATIYIPKTETEAVAAIRAAINEAKTKNEAKLGKSGLKLPLLDGDASEDGVPKYSDTYARGKFFIRASTTEGGLNGDPDVLGADLQPIANAKDVYSGMWVNISVNFYGYDMDKNKGIAAGLGNVQKIRDDDRLAGGPRGADEFSVEQGEGEDPLS